MSELDSKQPDQSIVSTDAARFRVHHEEIAQRAVDETETKIGRYRFGLAVVLNEVLEHHAWRNSNARSKSHEIGFEISLDKVNFVPRPSQLARKVDAVAVVHAPSILSERTGPETSALDTGVKGKRSPS